MKKKQFLYPLSLLAITIAVNARETGSLLINPDRVWTYKQTIRNSGSDEKGDYSESLFTLTRYRFGDTVEKYGREYTEWKLIDVVDGGERRYASDPEDVIFMERSVEEKDSVVAYMREEGSRVYMLLDFEELYIYDRGNDHHPRYFPEEGEETILYDFAVDAGGRFSSIYGGYLLTGMNAVNTEEITVDGSPAKKICVVRDQTREKAEASAAAGVEWQDVLDPHMVMIVGGNYVEGIGNVGPGEMTGWMDLIHHAAWFTPTFYNVCDSQGNIIYGQEEQPGQSGIADGRLNHDCRDGILYDLHGNRVVSPLPGTIYIRNGKKFVFK